VLVEIVVPVGSTAAPHVVAGTHDVSDAFARRADGRTTGFVTGLERRRHDDHRRHRRQAGASLTVYQPTRSAGPVFSGPQNHAVDPAPPRIPTPGDATTPATSGSGLSTNAKSNDQCNIASETKLYYRTTTAGCTLSLPDPRPASRATAQRLLQASSTRRRTRRPNLAMTTTTPASRLPYIVRVERG